MVRIFLIALAWMSVSTISMAEYSHISIGVPSQSGGFAYALNNDGRVATTSLTKSYLFPSGSYTSPTEIVISGVATTTPGIVAQGLNDLGEVVGRYRILGNAANQTSGFVFRTNGTIETFNYPGLASTSISSINDTGNMVGETRSDLSVFGLIRGFLYSGANSTFSEIHFPGATLTRAYGINDSNLVVGQFQNSDALSRPFVFNGSSYTELSLVNAPGGARSAFATGISDNGAIIGTYRNSADTASATWLRLSDGTFTYPTLPGIGWSVNNDLQISGSYLDAANGNLRTAFIASVPEPGVMLLLAAGLLGMFAIRHGSVLNPLVPRLYRQASRPFVSFALATIPSVLFNTAFAVAQHSGDILVGRNGDSQLIATNVPGNQISLPFISSGPFAGWASNSLGFDKILVSNPIGNTFTLSPGGNVDFELVSIDQGLSFRSFSAFTSVFADAPGERLRLGTTGSLHYHPTVLIDANELGLDFQGVRNASFRLLDDSNVHSASPVYSLSFRPNVVTVPEPSSVLMIAAAVAIVVFKRSRILGAFVMA